MPLTLSQPSSIEGEGWERAASLVTLAPAGGESLGKGADWHDWPQEVWS
jgi:hypothetical protein